MKNIQILILVTVVTLGLGSCKTTEANYRKAYETAKEKQLDGGEETVTQNLKNSQLPKEMNIGGIVLPVRTEPVGITKEGGGSREKLFTYNVVVAQFHQLFNANSMRKRLVSEGYDSFLVHNRDLVYYVVAGSVKTPAEAKLLLEKLDKETSIKPTAPFPYVLRAAHLVK